MHFYDVQTMFLIFVKKFLKGQGRQVTFFFNQKLRKVGAIGSAETQVFFRSYIHVQSTLVISTSVISNNRLSRRANLVLFITQKSKIRL